MKVDDPDYFFRNLLETTLNQWKGKVELDLAAVFDQKDCGLRCFQGSHYIEGLCVKVTFAPAQAREKAA